LYQRYKYSDQNSNGKTRSITDHQRTCRNKSLFKVTVMTSAVAAWTKHQSSVKQFCEVLRQLYKSHLILPVAAKHGSLAHRPPTQMVNSHLDHTILKAKFHINQSKQYEIPNRSGLK